MFLQNFCGIGTGCRWPVIWGTNTAYFGRVQAAVLCVYMISQWNTWRPFGLWWEEYLQYWAELIRHTAS